MIRCAGWQCLLSAFGLLMASLCLADARVDACPGSSRLPDALSLATAVSVALCADPKLREVWLTELARQADLDAEHSAYYPTVQGQFQKGRAGKTTRYPGFPEADSRLNSNTSVYGLNLSWVLFDFGLRAAKVESARQLLNVASSSRIEEVQKSMLATARVFYQVQANMALLHARISAERLAANSLKAADAKYREGAGEQTDRLQAQSSYAEAQLNRVMAEGDLAAVQGELASQLGLSPSAPLKLVELDEPGADEGVFLGNVNSLMEQARASHPAIEKARADWAASQAKADAAKAQGLPTVSLFSNYSRQDTPIEQVSTRQEVNTWTIGVQITVPIFDGFLNRRRARAARYESAAREQALHEVENSIALSVWKSRQTLESRTRALAISRLFVESASKSYEIAQGRYKAGVGSILELLRSQNDLSAATQKRVESLVNWHNAKLQLASDLGSLNIGD
ncbi:TolC family protein [Pseudomonas savastanoi pv. phaseolicola]|nr:MULTISPECIES: TolC family protein [Pseudomonas syringae group genomosp. 2]KPB38243.1 Protein CyaE [Pseudomonas savastanoi pv. phaseolicola]KPX80044.1 Protein CyaE [Pseudomonas amygdali pv. mellea]MBN3471049.1 TolC family protein [Pseudomonas savastanoi pv. phaseolicola]MBN4173482.1 Solvent efflux pump outer membrane protein SrpC [Pseudomonas savastanoi pv. phaseolicola]RMM66347.1 Protein CyaE [Pseudomonas savastanoi pv. glycinea]